MTKNDNPSVKRFLRQIKYDQNYAVKMISEDSSLWENAIELIYARGSIYYPSVEPDTSSYQEFIEFIEGNGYKIIRNIDSVFEGMIRCEIIAE